MHQRKIIRAAVVAKLKASVPSVANRVFNNRVRTIFPQELPCLLVYTQNEPAEQFIEAPREYKRRLAVVVECVTRATADDVIDDALDDICEEVEAAMFEDETFGGVASDCNLVETEMAIIEEGDKPVGAAKITFELPYYQRSPQDVDPDSLDAFETANVKIDTPLGDDIESEDDIELPQ